MILMEILLILKESLININRKSDYFLEFSEKH